MMTWQDWLSLGSVMFTGMTVAFAFLRNPPIVPASQIEDMRAQIAGLRAENVDCRDETARLRTRIGQLETEVNLLRGGESFWQSEYRKLVETKGKA